MSPEHDAAGLETLERFANAPAFNQWLYDSIAQHCSGRIVEIGSGIGNISQLLLKNHLRVMLSDLRQMYCIKLNERFARHPHFEGAVQMDIADENFQDRYSSLIQGFDTVIALNVVEHIQNDAQAIENCKQLLKPGGKMIILVPAYQWLFNSFDIELGHYRRYTQPELTVLLQNQGLEIKHTRYFNFAGIAGWWLTGSIMKKKTIPGGQLSLFNRLVPAFRLIDRILFRKVGLSVIAVAVNSSKQSA